MILLVLIICTITVYLIGGSMLARSRKITRAAKILAEMIRRSDEGERRWMKR
jgi:hypothetical protein